ncbi:GGDEF domain-containing protein [Ornithinibacillus bavariensis]|uniref:GGDEF domain-containing protein n=1 Tax=Ornithinibacillus bavariensis TaxID=545502 RepID=UPI000EE50F64|nr:hypothetical protein [Ornithinibacillus sp.]
MNLSYNFKLDEPIPYEKLLKLAFTDELTGLPNLRSFRLCLQDQINHSKSMNNSFAIVFMDFNNFKNINDEYGHIVGDKFLIECSKQILNVAKHNVFRKSGDEFLIIVENPNLLETIMKAFEGLLTKVVLVDKIKIPLNFSMGYSIYPIHGESEEDLLSYADQVMYENKRKPK